MRGKYWDFSSLVRVVCMGGWYSIFTIGINVHANDFVSYVACGCTTADDTNFLNVSVQKGVSVFCMGVKIKMR